MSSPHAVYPVGARHFEPAAEPASHGFQRSKALWLVDGEQLTLGVRTLITGRIELARTAAKVDPSAVVDQALELEAAGADFIEINPGPRIRAAEPPPADPELKRLVPALRRLAARSTVPISVVTANAETARRAIQLGASIVHDVTGLTFDQGVAAAVNESSAAMILGHCRGLPAQWPHLERLGRLLATLQADLRASLLRANKFGLEPRRIVLDPGLEHGKRDAENFDLIRSAGRLGPPGQGIQVDLAGKRFLVESVRASAAELDAALVVAATLAIASGAHLLTVDRPAAVQAATAVVDRIYREDERRELAAE